MSKRIFATDEELGKRDDDHKPGRTRAWSTRNIPAAVHYRRRRIVAFVVAGICVWFLLGVLGIGSSGADNSYVGGAPPGGHPQRGRPVAPQGPPPRIPDEDDTDAANHYYNGQIKFFELGESLHAISKTGGLRSENRNVLFAASNLKSVSAMIPLACEMAKWKRNYVHFAIMGRYDIRLDDILEVNGVDRDTCTVFWHDARPDYVLYSSDMRAEGNVVAAMGHIQNFMHPQVVVTDDSLREDIFFVRAIHFKAQQQRIPLIEVPLAKADGLEWLTRLDAGSLRSWHRPSIDVLIHAPPKSSGSLIRLIKSIQDADYAGLNPPRLIVELPTDIDPPTQTFLESLVWPPPAGPGLQPHRPNQVILRHRISDQKISAEEASVRFLESFYPTTKVDSHVLLLSPNVQLSPLYYQFLMFNLLEYKYSAYAPHTAHSLVGMSLEVPAFHLNGKTSFALPTIDSMGNEKYKTAEHQDANVPFMWQAPNANAALYFGDKWVEIHSFLSNRLHAFHSQANPQARPRTIHESQPSWLEYFLELMRARGYTMLYPGLHQANALISVHNELYQPLEETLPTAESAGTTDNAAPPEAPDSSTPFLTGSSIPSQLLYQEAPLAAYSTPLHLILPFNADPPELRHLPRLSHTGAYIQPVEAVELAQEVTRKFRESIGGCGPLPEDKRRVVIPGSARDLFCFGEGDEWMDVEKKEKAVESKEQKADAVGEASEEASMTVVGAGETVPEAVQGSSKEGVETLRKVPEEVKELTDKGLKGL